MRNSSNVEAQRTYGSSRSRMQLRPFVMAFAAFISTGHITTADETPRYTGATFYGNGWGETTASNTLSADILDIVQPGIQAEKILDRLPGVNVVSRDPFGFYEWGNEIRIRGFDEDQIGATVDGVPLGVLSPRYGTPIGRIIDPNNLAAIKVSQGSTAVNLPAYQALGGSLEFFTVDPTKDPSATFSTSFGTFNHLTVFGRVNTGEIVDGFTSYVSASYFEFEPRGLEDLATNNEYKLEVKLQYEFPENKGSLKYIFNYTERVFYDTAGLDWDEWRALETGVSPNPNDTSAVVFGANGWREYTPQEFPQLSSFDYGDLSDEGRNYSPPKYIDPTIGPGEGVNTIYYNLWRNGRKDTFQRMILDFEISDGWSLNLAPYYQDKDHHSDFGRDQAYAERIIRSAYEANPSRTDIWGRLYYDASGNPLDENGNTVLEYSNEHAVAAPTVAPGDPFVPGVPGRTAREELITGERWGLTGNIQWTTETNTLEIGAWYEFDSHNAYRPNYNLEDGSIFGDFQRDQFNFLNYSREIEHEVTQFWIQNTLSLLDGKLKIKAGVKALEVDRQISGILSSSDWINGYKTDESEQFEDYFLPSVGLNYRLNPSIEFFANYSKQIATPEPGDNLNAINTGQQRLGLLNPEYSDSFNLGLRGTHNTFSYSIQIYYTDYTDRISSVVLNLIELYGGYAFSSGNSIITNVEGYDSWGMEASANWETSLDGLSLFASLALQKTTIEEIRYSRTSNSSETEAPFIAIPNPNADQFAGAEYFIYEDLRGNDVGNTPFVTARIDAIYTIGPVSLSIGGKFYDDIEVNTWNTQPVGSYTVVEAGIAVQPDSGPLKGWTAAFHAYNLFDQSFWYSRSSNDSNGQVFADRGRQFTAMLGFEF